MFTTLYFESNDEDDLRKKGYSKDHKNELPQILVGLFVDKDGYPFDFDFYEGSTFEGHTFPKAIKALTKKYKFKDLVIVADAGMLSEKNLNFLETEKLNYIVGARLKSLSEKFKKRIFIHDYIKKSVCEIKVKVETEDEQVKQKRLIIDFSEKRAQKDNFNREKLIKKLELKLASKKEIVKKSKYLIWKNQGTIAGIDYDKIELDKRHDGLKGYWTNLNSKSRPQEVINQYHNL
jgi:transposase